MSRPRCLDPADEGIQAGSRVGVIGWKTYAHAGTIEVPAFLVDELRRAVGAAGVVENATDLLIDPARRAAGASTSVEQIAAFEWAACQTSDGVRRVITGLRAGHDRARVRTPARVERLAPVVPSDADRR